MKHWNSAYISLTEWTENNEPERSLFLLLLSSPNTPETNLWSKSGFADIIGEVVTNVITKVDAEDMVERLSNLPTYSLVAWKSGTFSLNVSWLFFFFFFFFFFWGCPNYVWDGGQQWLRYKTKQAIWMDQACPCSNKQQSQSNNKCLWYRQWVNWGTGEHNNTT